MGKLRKKIGLKFTTIMSYCFFIVLFLAFAGLLQYLIVFNKLSEDIRNIAQYAVYVFIVVALIVTIAFYIKYKVNIPIAIYEEGIFMKRQKVSIMYSEISTYYFTPMSNNQIKNMVVEKMNGDRFVFDVSYVGEDFVEYFQKDYIVNFTEDVLEKLNHGYEIPFGIMTGKQKTILKVIGTKSMARNYNFTSEFIISKDFFKYDDKEYSWEDINIGYDVQTGNIEILDNVSNTMILTTYFTYVEKGEFSFNIIDYLVDEIKNNPKDNTMKSDNEDANNSYEETNIEE